MKPQKRKYTTITIPTALFDNVSRVIAGTGFSSVSDYATYILRETTSELQLSKKDKAGKSAVIEKLRALGYVQ
jgi:metal-responsive CopG/Arc/MetJ family transcriptional regulator